VMNAISGEMSSKSPPKRSIKVTGSKAARATEYEIYVMLPFLIDRSDLITEELSLFSGEYHQNILYFCPLPVMSSHLCFIFASHDPAR